MTVQIDDPEIYEEEGFFHFTLTSQYFISKGSACGSFYDLKCFDYIDFYLKDNLYLGSGDASEFILMYFNSENKNETVFETDTEIVLY